MDCSVGDKGVPLTKILNATIDLKARVMIILQSMIVAPL